MANSSIGTAWIQIKPSMKGVAGSLKKEFGDVYNIGENTGNNFSSGFMSGVKNIASSIGDVFVSATNAATTALVALSAKGISTVSTMQSLQIQMNGLTKSTELGTEAMKIAQNYWENNPFQRIDVASSTKSLLAYGRSVQDLGDDLKLLGNISIVSGTSLEELAGLYGKVAAQGKVNSLIIREFSNRGISVLSELAKVTGYTEAEISENAGNLNITFDQLRQALSGIVDPSLVSQLENTIPRALDKLGGKLNTLATAFVGGELTAKGFEIRQNGIATAVLHVIQAINGLLGSKQVIEAAGKAGEAIAPIVEKIAGAITKMEPLFVSFFNSIAGLGDMLGPVLAVVALGLGSVASQLPFIGAVLPNIGGSILSIGKALKGLLATNPVGAIFLIVGALGALVGATGITSDQIAKFVNSIITKITEFAQIIISKLPEIIKMILDGVTVLLQSLPSILPTLVDAVVQILVTLVNVIIENLPMLIEAAIQTLIALANALVDNIELLVEAAFQIMFALVTAIITHLPEIVQAGIRIIGALISGIGQMIGSVGGKLNELNGKILGKIGELAGQMIEAGKNVIRGLINGIGSMIGNVVNKVKEVSSSILDNVKNFFGIHSPSRLMASMGKYLMQGLENGIDSNVNGVIKSAEIANEKIAGAFGADSTFSAQFSSGNLNEQMAYANNMELAAENDRQAMSSISNFGETTIVINGYNKDPNELAEIISRKVALKQRGVY